MAVFRCPVCNEKFFSEADERKHSLTHKKPEPAQKNEIKNEIEKKEEPKKEVWQPNFWKKFFKKKVTIDLITGKTVTGELTGFNNYDVFIDEKILILKHAIVTVQEVEG